MTALPDQVNLSDFRGYTFMLLKRITINQFSEIQNKTLEFFNGINLLYGEDQVTRNKIYSFLEWMFYENCEQENASGIIWFENQGKNYRLTREYKADNRSYELFCEESQTTLNGKAGSLEYILGGMSKAIYDNTVLISAPRGNTEAELSREIQNYMVGILGTADISVDLGRAGQMLKMWRKGYQTQKERSGRETQKEQEKLAARMEKLESELEEIKDRQKSDRALENEKNASDRKENSTEILDEQIRKIQSKNLEMVIATVFAVVIGLIGVIGRFQVTDEMSRMGMDVCIVGAVAAGIYTLSARRRLRTEFMRTRKQKARILSQQDKMKTSREKLEESYRELKTEFLNLQKEYQEYENEASLPTSEDIEIQGLNLAMDTIESISRDIQRQTGRKIRIRASRILQNITGGNYKDIILDGENHVLVRTVEGMEERDVRLELLEKDIMALIYFALHMAAGEVLGKNTCFPVIMAELPGNHSEKVLTKELKWLCQQPRQVFISASTRTEKNLMDKEKMKYSEILL